MRANTMAHNAKDNFTHCRLAVLMLGLRCSARSFVGLCNVHIACKLVEERRERRELITTQEADADTVLTRSPCDVVDVRFIGAAIGIRTEPVVRFAVASVRDRRPLRGT